MKTWPSSSTLVQQAPRFRAQQSVPGGVRFRQVYLSAIVRKLMHIRQTGEFFRVINKAMQK